MDINVSPFLLGCTGSSETFSITVNPTPMIDPINDTTLCSLEDLNYIFSGTTGATYNWTSDNTNIGLAANGSGNISSFTLTTFGIPETATIVVTPSIGTCFGTPEAFIITVNPTPTVTSQPICKSKILCEGDSSIAILFSSLAGTNYQWDATPSINATSIGLPSSSGTGNIASFLSAIPEGLALLLL